jgi:hypothetical protein
LFSSPNNFSFFFLFSHTLFSWSHSFHSLLYLLLFHSCLCPSTSILPPFSPLPHPSPRTPTPLFSLSYSSTFPLPCPSSGSPSLSPLCPSSLPPCLTSYSSPSSSSFTSSFISSNMTYSFFFCLR